VYRGPVTEEDCASPTLRGSAVEEGVFGATRLPNLSNPRRGIAAGGLWPAPGHSTVVSPYLALRPSVVPGLRLARDESFEMAITASCSEQLPPTSSGGAIAGPVGVPEVPQPAAATDDGRPDRSGRRQQDRTRDGHGEPQIGAEGGKKHRAEGKRDEPGHNSGRFAV